ncbi:NAD(P)/FAD-dependent oxidoreductase [Desulfotomaculum copahuensis]|uniref:Dehydrogenase n=1 Tax=Desulfotomaculum copahuensis TaxID=1838280 RepID=A0A1B7LF27_9FIRM|nr:NAD(P)/FAD-dependent oxidoreductase [Desulfotomaculum copahuensis]OAT82228.1 hypothetical protein A6M21_08645 [Desulfotomaculum copahuensis]
MQQKRVAVAGAGLAGLSCALALEAGGISPVVFERKPHAGQRFAHISTVPLFAYHERDFSFGHLEKNYGIRVNPTAQFNKLILKGVKNNAEIKGELGYLVTVGQSDDCLEMQLFKQLRTPVQFEKQVDPVTLTNEYDYVVVATGAEEYANPALRLGLWHDLIRAWIKVCTVLGNFEPGTLTIWRNRSYCRDGFAYLAPFNGRRATLGLNVTGISQKELSAYWQAFIRSERLDYDIIDIMERDHVAGRLSRHQAGNLLFTGDAGGFKEPLLGMGTMAAIASGVLAARAIINGSDYEELVKPLLDWREKFIRLRRLLDHLDDAAYDRWLAVEGLWPVRKLMFESGLPWMDLAGMLSVPLDWLRGGTDCITNDS